MSEWTIRDRRSAAMVLHPSTEIALEALRDLKEHQFSTILDIGCGSGLLSLAASEMWPGAAILAADISPEAVEDAKTNLGSRAQVLRADAFDHAEIRARGPYQLILCNLLADILIRTAPDLKLHLAQGGVAVLSGILAWMQPQVVEAHRALGFEILEEIEMKEWRGMVFALS